MNIRIYADDQREREITNLNNWTRPKLPEKHWKDGRSAKELAKLMTATLPDLHTPIEEMLKEKLNLSSDTNFIGIPEYETNLPGMGEGRNHDMLLWAEAADVVIGLEAKVDEALGDLISKKEFESQNSKNRLTKMYNGIFGTEYEFETIRNMNLMYQLLSGTYGTLKESADRKNGTGDAILLILTFLNGEPVNKKMKATHVAIEEYRASLKSLLQAEGWYKLPHYPDLRFWIEEMQTPMASQG